MNPLRRWVLAVTTLGLLAISAPAVATEDVPALWSGTVQSASGSGAAADVTAYLQPPVDLTVGEDSIRLPTIATTTADRDGHFTLRAGYDDRVRAAQDRAGWVSVLVVAMTSDGMSMATDSVRFDNAHNRWSTRPAEAELNGAIKAQATGPGALASDRPSVMTLHRNPAEPKFRAMASKYRICYMKKGGGDVGVTPVTVGELDMAPNWGGQFNYTDTNTSTVEVGFKYEGEGGWSAGGSTSFSKQGSSESINPVPAEGSRRHFFYRADMMFSTFRMDCGGRIAYELKPTMWTGGMRAQSAPPATCDRRFLTPVIGGSTFARKEGSSQTFSAAFSIVGFSAGAKSVNSNSVRHAWTNESPHTRNLCGASNFPSKDTRVVSLP